MKQAACVITTSTQTRLVCMAQSGDDEESAQVTIWRLMQNCDACVCLADLGAAARSEVVMPSDVNRVVGLRDRVIASDGSRSWRILAQAGGAIHQLAWHEQKLYPWKLFGCTEACPNQAIFNALAAQRWRRYQSVEQLLSTGSLIELVAMGVIVAPVTDNSSAIERGHTGTQRAARAREQTHDQRLSDISADRVIRQVQRIGLVWPGCIARTRDGKDTKGSFNPDSNQGRCLASSQAAPQKRDSQQARQDHHTCPNIRNQCEEISQARQEEISGHKVRCMDVCQCVRAPHHER